MKFIKYDNIFYEFNLHEITFDGIRLLKKNFFNLSLQSNETLFKNRKVFQYPGLYYFIILVQKHLLFFIYCDQFI